MPTIDERLAAVLGSSSQETDYLCLYLNIDARSAKPNSKSLCLDPLTTGSPVLIASRRKSRDSFQVSTAFPVPATARLIRCPPGALPAVPRAAQAARAPDTPSPDSSWIGTRNFPETDLRNRDQVQLPSGHSPYSTQSGCFRRWTCAEEPKTVSSPAFVRFATSTPPSIPVPEPAAIRLPIRPQSPVR